MTKQTEYVFINMYRYTINIYIQGTHVFLNNIHVTQVPYGFLTIVYAHNSKSLETKTVLRIRDVYPGSGHFSTPNSSSGSEHPGSYITKGLKLKLSFFLLYMVLVLIVKIINPGSRIREKFIPDPGSEKNLSRIRNKIIPDPVG
jgi:hypothetical protein